MHGESDLISAASNGDLSRVVQLLSSGVNVNCQDPNLFTPLNCAAWYGHTSVVEAILQHPQVDANKPGKIGEPPLFCAVQRRNLPVLKALLRSSRVDVNYQKRDGATPLLYAAQEGFEDEALLLLEDPRVDVNICLVDNTSPLFLAAQSGHMGIVKLLLALGEKINTGLCWGNISPVEQAKRKKHPELAELIEHFDKDPQRVRSILKAEVFKSVKYASHTFGLIVLHSDDYLRVNSETSVESNERRFFEIASRLPIEMQMVLSFRLAGMAKEVIPQAARQETFSHLAQKFSSEQRSVVRDCKREAKWKGWTGWTWQPFKLKIKN